MQKSLPCANAQPSPQQDEYLSSFVQHFSDISLLNTEAHPPPNWKSCELQYIYYYIL
ncbi:MAG: hypothetical protein IPP11_11755 [Chitinophagaceae bacterium]|nr:hypothetical protein [Chitinophagaceae bacterium]